ncbi:peptide chain release factor N(5)-glutamine methyltransferase [Candidatus Oleimmundimicrobium sp.]|uniref:peptide chain release factor N(5)-glutamine methyltransferase n=1 Tax=Candidatus Oleimmundimicrobium sp. TaxID=3060597 RepID=UPI002719BD51|nr:peptide chain release factor N(5)-glutamine methyltransferase [Candidatus Oleimmundimicrobium sp.]MDO8886088.1 peptide chain release factor N(5)-glutamine methyltransferase [Candidatus Oleimmundimicrobium sp.]
MVKKENYNVSEILKLATSFLKKNGIQNPRLDSELLLGAVLNISRVEIYTDFFRPLSPQEIQTYRELISIRAKGKPVAYILEKKPFRHLVLKVNQDVLIPRPETELVVDKVLEIAKKRKESEFKMVDLGTGSGAIALSIVYEMSNVFMFALDFSEKALNVARENAKLYGLNDKVKFICCDLFKDLDNGLKNKIDVIVSNPPYIPSGKINELQREIRDFEPLLALDGGPDGLKEYRRIIAEAPDYLKEDGYLILEIGENQADSVECLLNDSGKYDEVDISKDYAGIERIVAARRR